MKEPRWVPRLVLDAAHLDQLREHGGLPGLRDENALEAALARPRHKWQYEPASDLAALAAAYAFGFAKAHPFNDGNKQAAFLTAMIFLGLNGKELDATEAEVVRAMTALAAGIALGSGAGHVDPCAPRTARALARSGAMAASSPTVPRSTGPPRRPASTPPAAFLWRA